MRTLHFTRTQRMTGQNEQDKMRGLIFICLSLLRVDLSCAAVLNCTRPDPESMVAALGDLFEKKLVRPVLHFGTPTNVSVEFTLVGVLEVNEKAQTLTTFIWQVLEWDIQGLSWDKKQCGTQRISIPRNKLWVPDIHISEFMDSDRSPKSPFVYLDNRGHVYDDRPLRVFSSCNLNIYRFPFDVQNCSLTFGSYLHNAEDIRVVITRSMDYILQESLDVFETMGEWQLVDIRGDQHILELDTGNYYEAKFFIILKRMPAMYIVNLVVPSCFLITVDLFSFLLPPQSSDRASFKMTLILGYTVFLLIMNDLLPSTGQKTPIINVFFSLSLALMVASLLETVVITNLHGRSGQYPAVPRWIRVLVLRYLAQVVCLPSQPPDRDTVILNPEAQAAAAAAVAATHVNIDHEKNTPSGTLEKVPSEKVPSEKVPEPEKTAEPALAELKKLGGHLQAIRRHLDEDRRSDRHSEDWVEIANVVDRLLFGLYVVFIVVSFVTIICLWVESYHA